MTLLTRTMRRFRAALLCMTLSSPERETSCVSLHVAALCE